MTRIRWFHVGMTALCVCFALTMQAHALHSVDFTAVDGGYTVSNVGNIQNEWTHATGEGWWVDGNQGGDGQPNNLSLLTSPPIPIPNGGEVKLSFNHRYSFEVDWDTGAVFTSVNGGAFEQVPGTAFTQNGYTKTGLLGEHALNGGEGFNGDTAGFDVGDMITSKATLGTYNPGDSIQIQFYGAWDQFEIGALSPPEWNITSIDVVPEPTTLGLGLLGLLGLLGFSRRR